MGEGKMSSSATKKNHNILILAIVAILFFISALVIYFGVVRNQDVIHPTKKEVKIEGVFLTPPKEVADFNLMSMNGDFNKASLKGHWTMMFFGFTNCGVVCPTSMSALNKMYLQLQKELPDHQLPQVVMVSVDPERDTVQKIKSYVTSFNPNFIGVSGKVSDIQAVAKQFHIVAIKIQAEGQDKNNYSMDHSAEVLVFNPDAQLQAYLSYPHHPEKNG